MGTVGSRIRDARRSKRISLTALAGETCTKAHISAIELGKVHPSPRVLVHVCETLGLPLDEMAAKCAAEVARPDYVRTMCELLRAHGKAEKSLPILEATYHTVRGKRGELPICREIGRTYVSLEQFGQAERALSRAVDLADRYCEWPAMAEACFELGIALCRQGRYADAIECLSRSAKAAPGAKLNDISVLALFSLAGCLLRMGMYGRSLALYQDIPTSVKPATWLDGTPLGPLAHIGAGVALYYERDHTNALQAASTAIELLRASNSVAYISDALNNRAVCLLDLGQPDEAEHALAEALRLRGGYRNAYACEKAVFSLTELSRLHLQKGRLQMAKKTAERGLMLARQYGNVVEQGQLQALLMALSPDGSEHCSANVRRVARRLSTPEERVAFYSAVERVFRGTRFEAVGTPFLDEAIREAQALSLLSELRF